MTTANTNTDLRNGVNGDVGCKYPCVAATMTNIDLMLNGLSPINGVTPIEGDPWLVNSQTDPTENGVYVASSGQWERGVWFNNQLNVAPGTLVVTSKGTQYPNTIWETICADNPIQFGTSSITFQVIASGTNTGDITLSDESENYLLLSNQILTALKIALTNMANLAANSFIGNNTASPTTPRALTQAQATALLNVFVGDSGSGGLQGLVPAPAVGDGSINKFLRADGTWSLPSSDLPAEIIMYANNAPPSGYLECNGAAISRTIYAGLFLVIDTIFGSGDGSTTFNIPDLRGYFPRGWDNGRGVDSGRTFGSNQTDALQNITGEVEIEVATGTTVSGAFALNSSSGTVSSTTAIATSGKQVPNFDASRVARTATETRSINIALMFCIKY